MFKLLTRSLALYLSITALYFTLIVLTPQISRRRSILSLLYVSLWWPTLIWTGGSVVIPTWIK